MVCDITLYHDSDYRGGSQNITSTKTDLNSGSAVPRNAASSYKVNADESCLITGWTFPDLANNGSSRGRFLRGDEPNFNWRRKWNDNNWNDDLDSISIQTIPSANSNQLQYHLRIDHYTPQSPNDNYCGGCRWWPEVKNRGDFKNADRDDVMVREGVTFRPCPGGTGYFNSASGVRCIYSKTDDAPLRTLFANKNGITNDPRAQMHSSLKEEFCKVAENIFKNPGGGQCLEYDTTKALAKEYCSVSNRIATDASCTVTNLGNFYADVAEAYCKTAAGKADAWCSCYNVTNNVCDTDSSAAGCETKRQYYDPLVAATPQGFRHVWSGRAACFGGVCQGPKYIPQNANQNCNAPIQICSQTFDLSQISQSSIQAQCNLTANQNVTPPGSPPAPPSTPPSAGSAPAGPPPSGSPPSGTTPSETPPSGTPPSGGINDYIPRSLDELKTDSKKQMAVGGVGGLFLMCCCLLLLVLMSSGGGGGGAMGPTRFRR